MEGVSRVPIDDVIREISRCLRRALDVSLFGIDIIISNQTGQHAVIDINAFPGTCHSHVSTGWWGCHSMDLFQAAAMVFKNQME